MGLEGSVNSGELDTYIADIIELEEGRVLWIYSVPQNA